MNPLLATLGDPIWQVLALVITLAAPVLIVAVRTRDAHASEQQKRRDTLAILRVWLVTLLLMSGIALALHLPDATPQRTSRTAPPPPSTMAPTPTPTSTPTSIPTPTPTPRLARSITQVLTTFCDAINQHDLKTAWAQYTKALQKEQAVPPPPPTRITIVHCRVDQVSETSATGYLLLKTVGPFGYTDDYERPFQFTLRVEERAWKIAQIARCLADGCLPDTTSVVP
jgi:hypothetical protein